jgi:hypothetical protein
MVGDSKGALAELVNHGQGLGIAAVTTVFSAVDALRFGGTAIRRMAGEPTACQIDRAREALSRTEFASGGMLAGSQSMM